MFILDDARQDLISTEPPKPEDSTLIGDSLERVKKQLGQVPLDKKGAVVAAVKFKGFVPTVSLGTAIRVRRGWEIVGEGFISKVDQGGSLVSVWTW